MRREGNLYTFIFAFIVCTICSFCVSLVSEGLRDKKELNELIDVKKNILKAVDLIEPLDTKMPYDLLLKIYKEKIEEVFIDKAGKIISEERMNENIDKFPLYIYKENGKVIAYCFPITGKGLWSTIYGYLAIEADAKYIRGITFYKHGETPGLGAEISEDWFQDSFKGKSIWDESSGKWVCPAVIKGRVAEMINKDRSQFYVDGISGATMTSKSITIMLDKWLNIYEPYFVNIRSL